MTELRRHSEGERSAAHPPPLLHRVAGGDEERRLDVKVRRAALSLEDVTLGDLGLGARVSGPERFAPLVLLQPYAREALAGFDLGTTRSFRFEPRSKRLVPIWRSGVNEDLGFVWTLVRRPGVVVPLALPRDRLLQEVLRTLAVHRVYADPDTDDHAQEAWTEALVPFLEAPDDEVDELRQRLAALEAQTGLPELVLPHLRLGQGGHPRPFALPHDRPLGEVKERLRALASRPDALPELALLWPPEDLHSHDDRTPWPVPPGSPLPHDDGLLRHLDRWRAVLWPLRWCFGSRNWWMLHHDARHGGRASGCSDITSTSVHRLHLLASVALPLGGTVVTIPAVVDDKVYVGTYSAPAGGHLYRLDLATGTVEASFAVGMPGAAYAQGIGGSPAVVDGRVYFSNMPGRVYCLDATTFTQIWMTDLRSPDPAHHQPVSNPTGDCFSSPLVVNDRVYVGSGEGEYNAWGFVFCLDAATGNVLWLYCMNQFDLGGADNVPNVIPPSTAVSDPLPGWASAFTIGPNDPPHRGASVWSSLAYDAILDRVYACSGNSVPDTPLPDEKYASGIISLDAATGQFHGFFQPGPDDSYRPTDMDVDVPGPPTVFRRGGQRVVGFGSKNGSYFLLDPDTLQVLGAGAQRRQLLPRVGGSGLPGDRGVAIEGFDGNDRTNHENLWGVFGAAGVHAGLGRLYVGLGGYGGVGDPSSVPFLRALDWNTLDDAWPTAVGADNVRRYTTATPPLYTSSESGLSSPAIVNDVVFMSTAKSALYAFDAATGVCLWNRAHAPGAYSLGPAVYGNYVVVGAADRVHIYVLWPRWRVVRPPVLYDPWWWLRPWPPPWAPPGGPWPGPRPGPTPDPAPFLRESPLGPAPPG